MHHFTLALAPMVGLSPQAWAIGRVIESAQDRPLASFRHGAVSDLRLGARRLLSIDLLL